MNDSLVEQGLALVCETCECEIDFPDDHAELGVCRSCGVAFLLEVNASTTSRSA